MKKSVYLLIFLFIFIFSGCTIFQEKPETPKVPVDEFEIFKKEIQKEINDLNNMFFSLESRILRAENNLNDLTERVYRIRTANNFEEDFIKESRDSFSSIKNRLENLESLIFENTSNFSEKNQTYSYFSDFTTKEDFAMLNTKIDFFENSLDSLLKDIEKLEKSVEVVQTISVPSDLIKRIETLEFSSNEMEKLYSAIIRNTENLGDEISNLKKAQNNFSAYIENVIFKEDISTIYESFNNLNQRLNEMEKIYEESDFYFLQNGNLKELIEKQFSNYNFESVISSMVQYQTEQAVSKFYYKTESDSILRISELEKNVTELRKNYNNLNYDFQKILTRPENSFNERYGSLINDFEKRVNTLLFSLGDAHFQNIFENKNEILYEVKSGDTLSGISVAFDLGKNGVQLIMAANDITNANSLRVGQKLIIPINNIENYINWPLNSTKPVEFDRIVVKFGERIGTGISSGIGIIPNNDERLYPILPGKIIETGLTQNNKWFVKIDHGNSITSVSSGMETLYVGNGSWVGTNTDLGLVKKDELILIELWKAGEPKDPLKLFFRTSGSYVATYYTEWDDKLVHDPTFRLTFSGKKPESWRSIAADPSVLPIGTVVYIPELSDKPNKGFFVVEDTGGKIIGNKIDIYVNDVRLAQLKENVSIYIVGNL